MAKYELSKGALKDIMNGSEIDDAILQILAIRKISSKKCDFRALISDRVNMMPWAMISTQLSERLEINEIHENTIIKLKKYFTTVVQQHQWVIRVRVMSKSNLRTWSNSRGEGKLFSVDVADNSGEIRITAFREEAEKFYDIFQTDCVYYISKGTVKIANKQFNTLKNPFELTLTRFSIVQPCFDETIVVPEIKFNFVPIDKITKMEPNSIIDVIGICKFVSNIQNIRSRSNDREFVKRDIVIQDDTNNCVSVTLWGKEAEDFVGTGYPVLAIRRVRISEYNGAKQLSAVNDSIMKFDPDIPEAHRIKGWYENYGVNQEGVNISLRSGGFGTYEWKTLDDINESQIKDSEKGLYFQAKAYILNIRSNAAFYKACPSEICNKKVNDLQNGMYRCEKCNREYPNFKYRLITSANISDYSGSQWVQLFNDECEKILGVSAHEFGEKAEMNDLEAANICDKAKFKEYIFKCRTKLEYYNDVSRLKTVVMKCEPINYKEYNSYLIEEINQLTQNK